MNKSTQTTETVERADQNLREVSMTFDKGDASELFFIIRSRGFCPTRSKLLEVLFQLDRQSAERINAEDNEALNT